MDDKKNKKRYVKPEAEVIDLALDDIITESLTNRGTLDWGGDDNQEDL